MKTTVITAVTVLILVMMSGIAIADDQQRGMMSSDCPDCVDCTDVIDAMENLPFAQFDAMVAVATSGVVIEEEWAYERRNVAPDGIEHAYWDFEKGMNLYPFQNKHPNIASFENVSNARCFGNNEPSYVRKGANCGPRCRCKMHIYPYNTKFDNGTPFPYIHIVNGDAAFSPRAAVGGMQCYYPACSAFISFKDDTEFVSFLTSTGWNLYVRAYDKRWNYLGGSTIYCTTKRVGDEPSNFTRFTMHLPDKEIRYMTFSGPFNGWHIDDLIVGGEPGYLNKPVDYTYVADLAEELHGVWWCEHALGFDYEDFTYAEPFQFKEYLEFWNPETKMFESNQGISNPGLIFWAYNKDSDDLAGVAFVKQTTPAKMMKHDFKVDVDSADTQPGDVYFMDYTHDGVADFVGMVVTETSTGMNLIASQPWIANDPIGVIYSKKSIVEGCPAFMGYKRLPGVIKGGKNPVPKGH